MPKHSIKERSKKVPKRIKRRVKRQIRWNKMKWEVKQMFANFFQVLSTILSIKK